MWEDSESASIGGDLERGVEAFPALTGCVSTGFIIQPADAADRLSFLVAATPKTYYPTRWNPRLNDTCGDPTCEVGPGVCTRCRRLFRFRPASEVLGGRVPLPGLWTFGFPKPKHISSLGK